MNQEQNNLNQNNFNTQGNNGIPNNQPLNNMNQNYNNAYNQQQNIQPTQNVSQPTFNPQTEPNNFSPKPPKKINLGLIIGIIVGVVAVGIISAVLLLGNSNNGNNNSENNASGNNTNNDSNINDNVDKGETNNENTNSKVINIDANDLKFKFNGHEYKIGLSTYKEFSSQSGFIATESYNYPDQLDKEFYLKARQHSAYTLKNETNGHTIILHVTNTSDEQKNISDCVISGIRVAYSDWDMDTFKYGYDEPEDLIIYGVTYGEEYSNIKKIWGVENKKYDSDTRHNIYYYINNNDADYICLTTYDDYGVTGIEFVIDMFL